MLRGDDGAEPLDTGPGCPVDQVLLYLHDGVQRVLQRLTRDKCAQVINIQKARAKNKKSCKTKEK